MNQNEHNQHIDADILQCRKDILRAKDIVPHKPDGSVPVQNIEIPKFDLAEEIMAEQRKVTSVKRKAPGLKPEVQCENIIIKQQFQESSVIQVNTPYLRDNVIAEIVARDISIWCRTRH